MAFTNSLKLGLVGVGGKGIDHLHALLSFPNCCVVAVCDTSTDKLDALPPSIKRYDDAHAMIENEELGAVILCLPHEFYPEYAQHAAARGLHILKEKPLARSLSEATTLLRTVTESGVLLAVAAQRRFEPIFQEAYRQLATIGHVHLIQAHYLGIYPTFGWRISQERAGGGVILDMGYHLWDLLLWFFGMPLQVYAQSCLAQTGIMHDVEDSAVVTFQYETGMLASVILSRIASPHEERMLINGTQGTLLITRTEMQVFSHGGELLTSFLSSTSRQDVYQKQIEHFIDCIRYSNNCIIDCKVSMRTMILTHACYEAMRMQRPVSIPVLLNKLTQEGIYI